MKLLDRIAPTLEALSLAGLGAALAWMALSGRYGSFVPPSARLGILASGVGLLACALALSSRLEVGEGEHTHGEHTHAPASSRRGLTRASVDYPAALILILPFRVSPSELAATTISRACCRYRDEAEADPGRTIRGQPLRSPRERGWGRAVGHPGWEPERG